MVEYCWAHKKIVEHSKNHKNHTYEYVVIKCYQKCCCQSAPLPPLSLCFALLCSRFLHMTAAIDDDDKEEYGKLDRKRKAAPLLTLPRLLR